MHIHKRVGQLNLGRDWSANLPLRIVSELAMRDLCDIVDALALSYLILMSYQVRCTEINLGMSRSSRYGFVSNVKMRIGQEKHVLHSKELT